MSASPYKQLEQEFKRLHAFRGALGGYHWGEDRKRAMLAWQALATPASAPASLARRSAGQAT